MNPLDEFGPLTDGPFTGSADSEAPELVRIPLVEEQLQVTTQLVETGRVTLNKTVHETEQTVTVPLRHEDYTVERTVLNQYVDKVPATRQEGETTIYSVVKEVLVVQKRLLLIEEIRVTHQHTQSDETQTVRLRREDITVERTSITPERPT